MELIYKKGIHRPMVMGIQEVITADIDGFFGDKTTQGVKDFQKSRGMKVTGVVDNSTLLEMYPDMSDKYKILEVVACFEVGIPAECKNAWGKTTTIDDNAGKNYGVLQHNRFGTLQTMRKKFGFEDPGTWYGTPEGARGQLWYFETKILSTATDFAHQIGDPSSLTIFMLCDAITQGGGIYPTKPPVLWDDWIFSKEMIARVQGEYRRYQVQQAFRSAISLFDSQAEAYAEIHPRSGVKKFLKDQLSRRRTAFRGKGKVHGTIYDLSDFGLGPVA